MITVYRNSVQSWEIDQMGHMNVQFYFEKALQGCIVLWNKLGINKQPVELGNTYLSERLVRETLHFPFVKIILSVDHSLEYLPSIPQTL